MDQGIGAAAKLPRRERKDLAIHALAGTETVTHLAARHGVSRKSVYQQTHKARAALDDVFASATPDSAVRFELAVSKAWLRQIIVALALIGRSSYRGIVEFLRDLLGIAISIGCVHDVLQAATRQARAINQGQDLSGIRVGLHDEIFQGATPVLAGVDAASTYCYLLAAEDRRDADTWGVHLLDAAAQGLRPAYTIADAGQGLRAGQRAAWGELPCHGDVFHIQRQCEGLANTLQRLAQDATSRRKTLQAKTGRAGRGEPDHELVAHLPLLGRARRKRTGSPVTSARLCTGCATMFWLSPVRTWPSGASCSISSSPSLPPASRTTRDASVRCGWRCRTSVTTCSPLPTCSTPSWPTSHTPSPSPSAWCVRRACCTACPPRPLLIGKAGTGYARSWATSSTPWSPPSAGPWRTPRAAARWWKTSTHGCAPP